MNILLAYQFCDLGGIQAIMGALCQRFKAKGHACELFFFNAGPALRQFPADWAVHVGGLPELLKLVEVRRFEIVHAITEDWPTGISAVRHLGGGVSPALVLSSQGRIVPHWNAHHCDGLIGCSAWDVKEQQTTADFPVCRIYNGIDLERFSPEGCSAGAAAEKPIVAWVGRGSDLQQKRLGLLAAAAPALMSAGLRLWIADPDGPAKVPESLAKVLGPAAEFWGKIDWADMPGFYRRVAASGGAVLSTAAFEGLPLSLTEAQACGCPAIGADVRGVNECVRPEHGGVLYPADAVSEKIAELVIHTLGDKAAMDQRRKTCAVFAAECFGLARMVDEHLAAYQDAMQRRRAAGRVFARGWTDSIRNRSDRYSEWRMVPATRQYEASISLADQGARRAAVAAARAAFTTCPALFRKGQRMRHLARIHLPRKSAPREGHAVGA